MPQLITIGETMAAFTPDSVGALRYVQNFGIRTAGAESNVAVGLAKLGLEAAWVSRLGTDEFGYFIRNQLRAEGVDCSRVIYDPDHRTGIMFKETSVGETKVFYYRENSAASHLCPEDVTPALLDGVKILHMSGITPVLSESCLEMTKAAFALAKEKGVAISFDPNIRRKLWHGQDYAPLIRELTQQSEIVLLGLDEAEALFGLRDPDAIFDLLFRDGCAQYVAIKDGGNGAWVADKTTRESCPLTPANPLSPLVPATASMPASWQASCRVATRSPPAAWALYAVLWPPRPPATWRATQTPSRWKLPSPALPSLTADPLKPPVSLFGERSFSVWTLMIWFPNTLCWPSCGTFRWKDHRLRRSCRAGRCSLL